MKSVLLTISLFLFLQPAFPQDDPALLSRKLTASLQTDREKVTAIFRWITDHISYTVFPMPATRAGTITTEPDDDGPLLPLNERVSRSILQRRTALCDGYARLFKTLCDYAGIPAEIIQGYANNNLFRPVPRFGVNHYWNAVYFEGSWHLLDATWASGYVTRRGDAFIRDYDPQYFCAPPERFIQDHYPDDPRWTLLRDPQPPDEFRYSPFKQKSFGKYPITSFYPSKGIIDAAVGDTILLKLETGDMSHKNISPSTLTDSTLFDFSDAWVFLKPANAAGNLCQYRYPVLHAGVQWLCLLYNDDIVLRYRLNVKK